MSINKKNSHDKFIKIQEESNLKRKRPPPTQPSSAKAFRQQNLISAKEIKNKKKATNRSVATSRQNLLKEDPKVFFGTSACGTFFHVCRGGDKSHTKTTKVQLKENGDQKRKKINNPECSSVDPILKRRKSKKIIQKLIDSKLEQERKINAEQNESNEEEYLSRKKIDVNYLEDLTCKTAKKRKVSSKKQSRQKKRERSLQSSKKCLTKAKTYRKCEADCICCSNKKKMTKEMIQRLREEHEKEAIERLNKEKTKKKQKKERNEKSKEKVIRDQRKIIQENPKKQFSPTRKMIKKAFLGSL